MSFQRMGLETNMQNIHYAEKEEKEANKEKKSREIIKVTENIYV